MRQSFDSIEKVAAFIELFEVGFVFAFAHAGDTTVDMGVCHLFFDTLDDESRQAVGFEVYQSQGVALDPLAPGEKVPFDRFVAPAENRAAMVLWGLTKAVAIYSPWCTKAATSSGSV